MGSCKTNDDDQTDADEVAQLRAEVAAQWAETAQLRHQQPDASSREFRGRL